MRNFFNNKDPYEILDPNGGAVARSSAASSSATGIKYIISNSDYYSIAVVDDDGDSYEVDQDDDGVFDLVPFTENQYYELELKGNFD